MPLPGGLEKANYGTQGWSDIYDTNFEKLDEAVRGPLLADKNLGDDTVNNPSAITSEELTNNSGGTISNTIKAISGSGADTDVNDNFSSLVDEINKLRVDNNALRTTIINLLIALRKTGGCGVINDNP